MSDQEWERARSDHYRGKRYDREHQSESYTLARQQLERNADADRRQANAAKSSLRQSSATPLGSPIETFFTKFGKKEQWPTDNVGIKVVLAFVVLLMIGFIQWVFG